MPRRRHARTRLARWGSQDRVGTLEAGQALRPRHLEHRAAPQSSSIAWASTRCTPASGEASENHPVSIVLKPGEVSLAQWRAIYRGESAVPRSKSSTARIARSAEAVQRILRRNAPVYGINTGFGRLAQVRIENEDLATLQRNIVLSHCAGVRRAAAGRHRAG